MCTESSVPACSIPHHQLHQRLLDIALFRITPPSSESSDVVPVCTIPHHYSIIRVIEVVPESTIPNHPQSSGSPEVAPACNTLHHSSIIRIMKGCFSMNSYPSLSHHRDHQKFLLHTVFPIIPPSSGSSEVPPTSTIPHHSRTIRITRGCSSM